MYSYCLLSLLKQVFVGSIDIADPHATTLSLRLVNKASLDRILQAEVYVNESNGHLRAAHLILRYTPISRAFQASRCVIRARDPRLHRISVAYEGFVVPQGIPLPRYSPLTEPLPVATLTAGAASSLPPRFASGGGRGIRIRGRGFCGPHCVHRRLRSFQSTLTITKRARRYGYSKETPV